jgi:rSAM/selenodomain-associated transferase 1
MAKEPVAGRVKTRLARDIGVGAATRFARQSGQALLQRLVRDPRWETTLAVTPDAATSSRCWLPQTARIGQGGGDLGRRMQRSAEIGALGPVVIIGTDIPGITVGQIARAFRLLGNHDAVFGPAADGGYWLVGLRRRPHVLRMFGGVRWSGPHALADTLANLEGKAVAFVATLEDVDDGLAYARWASRFALRVQTGV